MKRVIDVRLNNTSQLAGFSKKDDLKFFLREVAGIEYVHIPELAPTPEIFEAFKKHKGKWEVFEKEFGELLEKRRIERVISKDQAHLGCLLCSEKRPHQCHRRLVAECLATRWKGMTTEHLE